MVNLQRQFWDKMTFQDQITFDSFLKLQIRSYGFKKRENMYFERKREGEAAGDNQPHSLMLNFS